MRRAEGLYWPPFAPKQIASGRGSLYWYCEHAPQTEFRSPGMLAAKVGIDVSCAATSELQWVGTEPGGPCLL